MASLAKINEKEERTRSKNQTTAVGFPIKTSSPITLNEVLTQFLPQGHEKVIRNAFFNTITICSVLLVSFTLVAVYFVLEPFLRPLLWSLLAGSFLFPFKHRLTRVTRSWFNEIRDNNRVICLESVSLPFKMFNWIIDGIIGIMIDYCKLLIAIFVTLLTIHLLMFYFTFTHILILASQFVFKSLISIYYFLQSSQNTLIITSSALSHLLLVSFCWNEKTSRTLIAVSPFIWISMICQMISLLGTFGLFLMLGCLILVAVGVVSSLFGYKVNAAGGRTNETQDQETLNLVDESDGTESVTSALLSLLSFLWSLVRSLLPLHRFSYSYTTSPEASFADEDHYDVCDESHDSASPTTSGPMSQEKSANLLSNFASPILSSSRRESLVNQTQDSLLHHHEKAVALSNVYIYGLLWTCCLAYIWMNPQILLLSPIPLAVCGIRWMWRRFYWPQTVMLIFDSLTIWFDERRKALIHPFLMTIFRYLIIGDKMLAELLLKSVDTLCSLSVILVVVFGMLLAAAFLAFQIYGESIHLVNVFGSIVNSTLANHPEFNSLFSQNATSNMTFFDEVIGNAYLYGRKWLKNSIRSVLNVGSDESLNASIAIEHQMLEVWDRSYQMWLTRDQENANNGAVSGVIKPKYINTGDYNWNTLIDALKTLNFSVCFNVFKENLDTVMSVLESLWLVLKGNLSLFFSAFTAVCSLLLSGSSALLNGLLNFIVFSTSLFYLLCASEDQYKPIEWASKLIPATEQSTRSSRRQNKFVRAMNEGINSVFAASFKMTTFYGLYTWLIHTLFQARLVYIPSVTAALLGAVPFIGSYWASFPAVLELWLVHGLNWKALLMFTCSILPMYLVDSEIYAEIKGGGHPYLTGLAIAGGVFFLGIEGAIFGPILLCGLFVAMNIYTSIMNDHETAETTTGSKKRILKRMNSNLS